VHCSSKTAALHLAKWKNNFQWRCIKTQINLTVDYMSVVEETIAMNEWWGRSNNFSSNDSMTLQWLLIHTCLLKFTVWRWCFQLHYQWIHLIMYFINW
jgi:hypothetical protein